MTENKFNMFHNEQAERMRRQVMEGLKNTQNYINYSLRGQYQNQPTPNPTGSFNRMSSHSFNTSNLSQMKQTEDLTGGAQTREGHNLIMNQLKNRALQLEQLSAGLPQQQRQQQTAQEIPDTVSTSFELFFSSLTSADFSLSFISSMNKDAKQALGNLKAYGLDLDKQTLERYAQITEAHLDNYLTNIDELYLGRDIFGPNLTTKTEKKKAGDLYLEYLERLDYYEVIFKIYLTLQALINSFGTSPDTRKQAFNGEFKNIIMAPLDSIITPEIQTINEEAKKGIKTLKDILPKNAYQEIEEYFESESAAAQADGTDYYKLRNSKPRLVERIKKLEQRAKKATKQTANKIKKQIVELQEAVEEASDEEDSEDDLPEAPQPPRTKRAQTPAKARARKEPAVPATPAPVVPASPVSPLDATIRRLYDDLQRKEKRLLDHIEKYGNDDEAIENKRARNHRKDLRKQYNKAKRDFEAQEEAREKARETPTKPPTEGVNKPSGAAVDDETDGTGDDDEGTLGDLDPSLFGEGMNPAKFTTNFLKGSGPMFKQIEQVFKGKRRLWK